MDLKEKGAKLKELLGLEGSAVAVKLAKSKDEIPAGYEELGEE